eukprot:gnl/TRDRNA2_/TRDRNA2_166967_c0_seq1.p1 gnl/TRDRNA2_/TRDRNA2_166967_c0~~gnl/TRDRNA2_/TRDRNA2_166967_c0_seq1.p1  ORF type:complete len:244 (-),score=36.66 gnl/TRDRNA2_/TRDRNA2_166967_c0_seq1:186-917(-)
MSSPDSRGASDAEPLAAVSLEVANALLLSWVLTEVLLRQRKVYALRVLILAFVVLNFLLSPRVHAAVGTVLALFSSPRGSTEAVTGPSWLQWLTASIAVLRLGRAARAALRILAAVVGFAGLVFYDVRRLRPKPYSVASFLREFCVALRFALPVYPILAIGFSCIFLVVVSVFTKLGLPQHLGEECIFYGQFYAPLSSVYWIMKKDLLANERATPVLPMASGAGGARTGHVLGGGGGRRLWAN